MRTDKTKRAGKLVHEKIAYQGGFPVGVGWGRGKITPGHFFLAYHQELEFHYIKRGEGSYIIENQNYPFHKNSLLVIRPNEIHCFIPKSESYIETGALMFNASLVKDEHWLTRFSQKFPHLLYLPEKEATMVEIILNGISEEKHRKERYWQEIILLKLKEFLLLVKRVGVQNPLPHQTNPRVSRILTHIEENFTQNLTCNSIADKFALSPDYLSQLFRKQTGLNLKHYILQRRIVEAKKLLMEQPILTVNLIPKKVGFTDFALFNRSFKIITGLTPTTYRKILHRNI